jgi:hypothetical protein
VGVLFFIGKFNRNINMLTNTANVTESLIRPISETVSLKTFLHQVFLLEKINIKVLDADEFIQVQPYLYRQPFGRKNTLNEFKNKRIEKYLSGLSYYFYALDDTEWVNNSRYVYYIRDIIIDDLEEKQRKLDEKAAKKKY